MTSQQVDTTIQQQGGVFFAPPQRRRQPQNNLYFAPQRSPQMLSLPGKPGITFQDTASSDTDDVRR